ncbi:DUF4121 family protein [Sphingomonas qomolangmaensis]|uniref:DUF4121 family protein n=1 Tax=Sphingomonas qomolangmaensis TaxID=2918765 RepID=A0ABY5LBB1_9SPHN|nr:DUF4121 family protein [Sphingomonas qomolangmaensis]UUL84268.1 DUF4121 family protein [Sphingomonas qomolangmaensis]
MRGLTLATVAAATMVAGCAGGMGGGLGGFGGGLGASSGYDYNRPDPSYGGYEADRYYRENPRVQPRRLSANDRVYRGRDNRYYCRRNDGTTGLIVGGLAGGTLGSILAPGGSSLLGALLGGAAGAAGGQALDRNGNNQVECR